MDHGHSPHLTHRPLLPLEPHEVAALAPDDPRAEVLLTRWDELPPDQLAALGAHPALGRRLARLRAAEDWLGRGLATRRERAGAVPGPEELFDYAAAAASGGVPAPLTVERRRAVERHLEATPREAAWVDGLKRRPPSPLLFDAPRGLGVRGAAFGGTELEEDDLAELADGDEAVAFGRRRGVGPRLARWAPLAAAALVLATGVLVVRYQRPSLELPLGGVVRGVLDEPLHFPRGRVLAAPAGAVGLFASEPRYEFAAVPGATGYRVELRRHSGGAFEVGEPVFGTEATATEVLGPALAAGRYTWEAFATVDGLERSLGTLDFHVAADGEALERLAHEPLLGQVRSLAADGLTTDARHRARLLPAGPERDRFLRHGEAE